MGWNAMPQNWLCGIPDPAVGCFFFFLSLVVGFFCLVFCEEVVLGCFGFALCFSDIADVFGSMCLNMRTAPCRWKVVKMMIGVVSLK